MAWPSDLVRTKNWGTEILTDSDLEGQFDLIINWVMAVMDQTTGHKHDGTANEGPLVALNGASIGVSGELQETDGGTGLSAYTQGDILYASAANTLSVLNKSATATRYLSNTGTDNNPAWAQINIINGLTIASQAQGDIIYADSATTFTRLGAGTSGQFLKTQGAGANPAWATLLSQSSYAAGNYPLVPVGKIFSGTDAAYTLVDQIYVPRGGTLRINFTLRSSNASYSAIGKIYRNGSPVGTERATGDALTNSYSEDISGWSSGDFVQLYVYVQAPATYYSGGLQILENVPATEERSTTYIPAKVWTGTGAPDGVLGSQGDLYLRLDGAATTTLYVKTGASTWTAK